MTRMLNTETPVARRIRLAQVQYVNNIERIAIDYLLAVFRAEERTEDYDGNDHVTPLPTAADWQELAGDIDGPLNIHLYDKATDEHAGWIMYLKQAGSPAIEFFADWTVDDGTPARKLFVKTMDELSELLESDEMALPRGWGDTKEGE